MNYWLKCEKVTKGMFPDEYAVAMATMDGRPFSLFAEGQQVDEERSLLRVRVLQILANSVLIYLPAPPIEITSRAIEVPADSVFEEEALAHQ